jgi:hypothetical protein
MAFASCRGLTSVTIPNSVETIESGTFQNCTSLTRINSQRTTPPTIKSASVFANLNQANITLYVPVGSKTAYSQADGWKEFANIVETTFTGEGNASATIHH